MHSQSCERIALQLARALPHTVEPNTLLQAAALAAAQRAEADRLAADAQRYASAKARVRVVEPPRDTWGGGVYTMQVRVVEPPRDTLLKDSVITVFQGRLYYG